MNYEIISYIKNYDKFTCDNLEQIINSYDNVKFSSDRIFIKNIISVMQKANKCDLRNISELKKQLYERFVNE